MTAYTHWLTIAYPLADIETAQAMARITAAGNGGPDNFNPSSSVAGAIGSGTASHTVFSAPCTGPTAQQVSAMRANVNLLHGTMQQGYAAQYPELTPPSLADCQRFLDSALIDLQPRFEGPMSDPLPGWNLEMIQPQGEP